MEHGFRKWWNEDGRFIDPDTSNVSWFDKREALAELAFDAGVAIGLARSRNYTADEVEMPSAVLFANGRVVRIAEYTGKDGIYLEVE